MRRKSNQKRIPSSPQKDKLKSLFSLPKIRRTPAAPTKEKRTPSRPAPKASVAYLLLLTLVIAGVTGSFVYHLHVRFQGVWLGYETSKARAERARLLVERRELRLELASLKAPGRIEHEAREKLGMEIPDHKRIIPVGQKTRRVWASGGAR